MKVLNKIIGISWAVALFFCHLSFAKELALPEDRDVLTEQGYSENPPLRKFDPTAMESYKEQSEFDYSTDFAPSPSWFGLLLFWMLSKMAEILNLSDNNWLADNFFNLLMVIGIIVGVVLIIRMRFGAVVLRTNERSGQLPVVPVLEEEQNYEQLFQQARDEGDLRLASRYLYIKTLQALHKRGMVKLMKWKTVLEYMEEIPADKQPFFQKVAVLFESTWYGDYEPTEQDFQTGISSSNQLVS